MNAWSPPSFCYHHAVRNIVLTMNARSPPCFYYHHAVRDLVFPMNAWSPWCSCYKIHGSTRPGKTPTNKDEPWQQHGCLFLRYLKIRMPWSCRYQTLHELLVLASTITADGIKKNISTNVHTHKYTNKWY